MKKANVTSGLWVYSREEAARRAAVENAVDSVTLVVSLLGIVCAVAFLLTMG